MTTGALVPARAVEVAPTNGDVGPCAKVGCNARAAVRVTWRLDGYGDCLSWYCATHAPDLGAEA